MGDKPRAELFGALRSLYQSREYSDLTIIDSNDVRHPVHKVIICPRSPFFATAVREGRWREGQDGEIALPHDDQEAVQLMIEYFYVLDYKPQVPSQPLKGIVSSPGDSDTMRVRTEAGQYGHVYGTSAVSASGGPLYASSHSPSDLSGPRQARERSDSSLSVHAIPGSPFGGFSGVDGRKWKPNRKPNRGGWPGMAADRPEPSPLATEKPHLALHAHVYALAHKYGVEGLQALALDKFKIQLTRHWDSHELAEAIQVVYTSTPSSQEDIREAVADTLGSHAGLLDKPEIEAAVMEINGLAYELLKRSRRAEPEFM